MSEHFPDPQTPADPIADPAADAPLPVCDYTGDSDVPCEEPATQRRWSSVAVVVSAVSGAVVGGALVALALLWGLGLLPGAKPATSATATRTASAPATQKVTIDASKSGVDVAEAVAEKAVPSVVNVTIAQTGRNPYTGQTVTQDVGNGSGVIIRSDGYILTNYHVIDGASRITVSAGVEDKVATVVGYDSSSDLAVLKIDGGGYPAIDVGSSKGLKVGQFVMAVGSPFGLEKTVTSGIVSALQRSEMVQGENDITTYTNLIQTDAAINPGNSGGALVDERGRLVGINALIQTGGSQDSAQSAGIGFAIPVDFAMDIAEQIIKTGKATHPFMGVSTQTIDESVAAQNSLGTTSGALVRLVQPASPAEKAGIKRGDIITGIGGREILSVEDVFAAIREHRIGETVKVDLVRADTKLTVALTLGSDAQRR